MTNRMYGTRLTPLLLIPFLVSIAACARDSDRGPADGSPPDPSPTGEPAPATGVESSASEPATVPVTSRNDLARFFGEYGDPEREQANRTFWVAESCDGRLRMGAMWGDASPWYMRSVSDLAFEQTGRTEYEEENYEAIRLQFETGAEGEVTGMTFYDWEGNVQRLDRLADLPESPAPRDCPG